MRIRALSLSLLLLTTCGDHAIVGPPELRGEWLAVFLGEADGHTEERMTFGRDGSFRHEILWYGYYGLPATTLTGYAQSLGRYRMPGDTLMLRIARFEEWQKYAVGPNPRVVTTRKPEWAERGTVHVEYDRLFHTFVAAPLDVPTVFTQEYHRVR